MNLEQIRPHDISEPEISAETPNVKFRLAREHRRTSPVRTWSVECAAIAWD
jgi:hypothetical protein